jgi:hypothetical protein
MVVICGLGEATYWVAGRSHGRTLRPRRGHLQGGRKNSPVEMGLYFCD